MTTTATDPSERYEELFAAEQEAIATSAEYEAKGWAYAAKIARNRARGFKAARTTIARREGWR